MINILQSEKKITVPYGRDRLELKLDRGTEALFPDEPSGDMTPDLFTLSLGKSLIDNGLNLEKPILIVTDKTRLCSYPDYLPLVVETINRVRRSDQSFPIIIAYGTHPRQTDEESLHIYGSLYKTWPFTHHDCDDTALFEEIGTSAAGTPVRLRKDLLAASAIITMGPICHHYFAGYGGGRKLIFPGCGERHAIYSNHGLFLDSNRAALAPACRPGNLYQNPIADDLFDIESFLPAQIGIHGIQDSHGMIVDFIIGTNRKAYLDACRKHAKSFEIKTGCYDTVVASCGGQPKDINFIQAHKAIHNSAQFVRDGGRLIVFAECPDSIGSETFLPWFSAGSFEQTFAKLSRQYVGNGGTALAMMTKTKRIEIGLVTRLTEQQCKLLSVEKWDLNQVRSYLAKDKGSKAWIANASLLVKQ